LAAIQYTTLRLKASIKILFGETENNNTATGSNIIPFGRMAKDDDLQWVGIGMKLYVLTEYKLTV
jgi:hypothetical protein